MGSNPIPSTEINNIKKSITYKINSSIIKDIITAIAYFDVFQHPLTFLEISNLGNNRYTDENFKLALVELVANKNCFNYNEYYSLQSNVKELVNHRLDKEKAAKKYFEKLPAYVKLISKFPFVRAIAISGSLSKGVMYKDGDIDYFIVTAPNRLWIARTFLVMFKKIFLLNSKKYFCVNYFVDENNMKIIDKNIFTAIEISYLLPVFNEQLIAQLKNENEWTANFFPNFKHPLNVDFNTKINKSKKGLEILFNESLGEKIDKWFMKLTLKRWQQKFSHFDNEKFELAMRSNRGISKHHPQDFQNRVLSELDKKISVYNF